jgi:hypothetical protein
VQRQQQAALLARARSGDDLSEDDGVIVEEDFDDDELGAVVPSFVAASVVPLAATVSLLFATSHLEEDDECEMVAEIGSVTKRWR